MLEPSPRISSTSDPDEVREIQARTADQLGQPVPHDAILEGVVYSFSAADGKTYVVGCASHYGRGDVDEAIDALD